jgi:alpha-L-arabinofuranosidase
MNQMKNIISLCLCLLMGSLSFAQNNYTIQNKIIVEKPVSPLLLGSFIEMGFGRSENLWAEMLYNRSFEEDTYNMTDWVTFTHAKPELEDWWHSGYETQQWYLQKSTNDKDSKYSKNRSFWPSCHSKTHISVSNKSKTEPVYFAQNGMYLRKNMSYKFSGYFNDGNGFGGDKMTGQPIEITIGLYQEKDFSKPVVEQTIKIDKIQYNKYEATLNVGEFEGRATFAIKVPSTRNIGLDLVSLMPADNVKGWRRDVIETIKNSNLPLPIMRFPGGCYASFYDWKDGIGDPFYRPVELNSFWNNPVMNDIGTVEFIELCRETKTEAMFCVPLMFKPIETTLDWVSFCNSPNNSLRAKYGHPEPLNVKYWELDNEMYRRYDAITYANKCVEYAKAMKAIDPSIKLIMGDYWVFNKKLKEMLEIAGQYIDLVNNRGGDIKEQASDIAIIREYNKSHNRNIQLCHSEFRAPTERFSGGVDELNRPGSNDNESLQNKSTHWAFAMSVVNQCVQFQNFGGDYAFLNFTSLNDTWGENLINIAKEKVYLSAAGRAFQFLNKLNIAYPLQIDNKDVDIDIVLQAAWSTDKKQFTLVILNFGDKEKNCSFDIKSLNSKFKNEQRFIKVYAPSLKSFNSFQNTGVIQNEDKTVKLPTNNFAVKVKAFSANAYVFNCL